MGVIKHEPKRKKREIAAKLPADTAVPDYRDSQSVADAIDGLASIVSTYVTQARCGDNGSSLYSEPFGYPVRLRLLDDGGMDVLGGLVGTLDEQGSKQTAALERMATAFERIADALAAKTGQSEPTEAA